MIDIQGVFSAQLNCICECKVGKVSKQINIVTTDGWPLTGCSARTQDEYCSISLNSNIVSKSPVNQHEHYIGKGGKVAGDKKLPHPVSTTRKTIHSPLFPTRGLW